VSPDLVRQFAELVAEPGTPASYIDQENKKTGSDSLEAASRSRRAYFVVVRDTILAIDCDCDQLVPVLDEIKTRLIGEGLVPVVLLSGGAGRRHLFCLILDPRTMRAYKERVSQLGHGTQLEVRPTIRPPLSPHRLGLRVALHSPEDPAEAIAALTPQRPKALAAQWMDFLRHGAPVGERSEKIQGFALAAVNAGWAFGDFYRAMMANRGGEKVQGRRDAERYLERSWESAVRLAKRKPPVQDRPETIALIARMRSRVETWPWPKLAGETYRRVLVGYLTIAERTGKLVFAASVRTVADLAEVSIGVSLKATRWLQHEGWLRPHQGYQRGTADAAIWRVQFPSGADLTVEQLRRHALAGLLGLSVNTHYQGVRLRTVHGTPQRDGQENEETESVHGTPQGAVRETQRVTGTGTEHDLWRAGGLGARAGGIYRLLDAATPISAKTLALRIGCRPQAVRRQLVGKLGRHGLAVKTPAGWLRGDADLDAVATELGVAGKGAAQRDEHRTQSIQFKKRLDEGGLRRRTNGR
jgi:hypothetical protein